MVRFRTKSLGTLPKRTAIFLMAALLSLTLHACSREGETKSKDPIPEPKTKVAKVASVEAKPLVGSVEYVGALSAIRKAFVATEMGGSIEKLFFERGDRVKKGQVLAEIGTRSLHLEVQQAEAARDLAEFQLKKMEKGSRPEEIQIARAVLEQADAAIEEAENNFKRIKGLHDDGVTSKSEYDSAKRALDTARANLKSAKQQLELAEKGPRTEDREAARANRNQSLAALAMAKDRLRKSVIRSPCDGRIALRKVEEGEVVGPGTVLTQVVDNRKMKIMFSLGERYLHHLDRQKRFVFSVDAIPGLDFTGILTFVSPTADPTNRSFPIELSVDNPDPRMADGMTVRVKFSISEQKKSIKVPSAWLSESDGHMGLLVVENGRAVFKPVKLGGYYEHRVEILSGLGEKDLVITNPAVIKPGDEVEY